MKEKRSLFCIELVTMSDEEFAACLKDDTVEICWNSNFSPDTDLECEGYNKRHKILDKIEDAPKADYTEIEDHQKIYAGMEKSQSDYEA